MIKILYLFFVFSFSCELFAFGVGAISVNPLLKEKRATSFELTGVFNNGAGIGIQTRYSQTTSKDGVSFDVGGGLATGKRDYRLFAAIDSELFPDYEMQPRISLKTQFEFGRQFDYNMYNLGIAPIVSKGMSLENYKFYPFLSIPLGLSLDHDERRYEIFSSLVLGATGLLHFEELKDEFKIGWTFEANFNLGNSFSGLYLGGIFFF